MTQFDPSFVALQATGVRYVVVGGLAVNLHSYQRFTKAIDLVIDLMNFNAEAEARNPRLRWLAAQLHRQE